MIKLIVSVVHALLWDANAARRWIRGSIGVLAVSGAGYADQVAGLIDSPGAAKVLRGAAVFAAFTVAAHDAQKRKKIAVAAK